MTDAKPESTSLPTEHVTVDGIEGKYARVELPDGTTADWLLSTLPEEVKEGDLLTVKDDGETIEIDHTETRQRRERAQSKLEALNKAGLDGEITL